MAQKYAKGSRAWGICGRSGKKVLLNEMVFDGRYPNMRVAPDWYEGKHPQEYLPAVDDPTALFRPSPEVILAPSAPVLQATQTGQFAISVVWTPAVNNITEMESYTLFRSIDGAEFVQLAFCRVLRDFLGSIIGIDLCTTPTVPTDADKQLFDDAPVTYVDGGLTLDSSYCYYVFGTPMGNVISQAEGPPSPLSNTACVTIDPLKATTPVLSIQLISQTVHLTWTPATVLVGTIASYQLWVQVDNAGPFTHFADTAGNVLFYDYNPTVGHEYHYYVVAVPSGGLNSDNSNIVDAIISNDPFFANVVLLLHADGTNGQTTTIDSSIVVNPVIIRGAGSLSTTAPQFGTAAFFRPGATSNLDAMASPIVSSSPLDILSGNVDFTIEGWVKIVSAVNDVQVFDFGGDQALPFGASGLLLRITPNPGQIRILTGSLCVDSVTHVQWITDLLGVPALNTGQWYHWAIQRVGGFGQTFFNGAGGSILAQKWENYAFPVGACYVGFGHTSGISGVEGSCYLDEVRITRGLGRYSGLSYTIPTAPTFP